MIDTRTVALLLPITYIMLFSFFAFLAYQSEESTKGVWYVCLSYMMALLSGLSVLMREVIVPEITYVMTNLFGFLTVYLFYLGIYYYLNNEKAQRKFGIPFLSIALVAVTFYSFVNDVYYMRVLIWVCYQIIYQILILIAVIKAGKKDENHFSYKSMAFATIVFILLNIVRFWFAIVDKEYITLDSTGTFDSHMLLATMFISGAIAMSFVLIMNRKSVVKLKNLQMITEQNYREAVVVSETDFLTGMANRMKLDESISSFIKLARKSSFGFSALLIDIDNFKYINDTYGHLQGDKVLKTVANMLKRNFSDQVVFGRWGGDEFLVLLPNMRYSTVNEIRKGIHSSVADYQIKGFNISLSIGIQEYKNNMTEAQLFEQLDKDLYLNKKG